MTKKLLTLLLTGICLSTSAVAADIEISAANFPDAQFREYLIAQSYGQDGVLTDEEINGITKLAISDKGIATLKGIELFTALKDLDCSKNKLTALDVSTNTKLTQLHCNGNQLPALNVTMNTALQGLWCGSNQLTTLDVSKNTALTKLYCNNNHLTKVDVSSNKALTTMNCAQNPITALDLSKNQKLAGLSINRSNIKGANMDTLISSLPTNTTATAYQLWVINNSLDDEGNECTKAQVAALKAKGWTALIYSKADKDWVEYVGSGKQLKYLVVWTKDGTRTTHALKDNTQVKFTDAALVVSKGSQKTTYPMRNMMRFTYETVMPGDVNGDAKVDIVDVAKTINYLLTFTRSDFPEQAADIDKSGTVDSDDVTAMIKLVVNGQEADIPASSQQATGDAFYIYRNDGQFNAFFRDEVEKMEYSNYDTDGNLHAEVESQVVYTADSVYNIPLTAIDSVGFVTPETIFQPNVVKMEQKGLMDYLQAVDGMSLLFSPDIPYELQPKVDDVLLYTEFKNPLLEEGFVGKVKETQNNFDAFRVDCDSIYDIFDIFEQLISIETIKDESAASRQMVDGEWISNSNSANFNLGYSHPLSDGEVSLSGSVDGTYIATVTYNITRKEQYINVKINHDWQYGAHLNFKTSKSFGTLIGPVAALPAIRFPAVAPVFKFQISGAPFVKGEGNMELDFSLNSPVHSYVCEAYYRNGHFAGWNHKRPLQGSNSPSFQAAFSLNGSVQVGYMVDFWLGLDISIKGIAKDFLKLGTGLDFYIGPKLSGDFSMKMGTENPVNYYSIYQDSKIGIDWLHVDYEFFGEASLAGHKFPKAMFCNGSIQSPLNHEWYIMPEFSDLEVEKDAEKKKATISTTPSRDILFPLSVGMGLYDSEGSLLGTKYESQNYKRENEGFEIQQTFSSLDTGKEYTAKPFVKILGGEVPALPVETFKLEGETSCPDENHPHMIDLGLPSGTKWACCNLGASAPEQFGSLYAWGETRLKSYFSIETYAYAHFTGEYQTYFDNATYTEVVEPVYEILPIGNDISGTIFDAARVNWGAPWCMPNISQVDELYEFCTSERITQKGVEGERLTGSNGGSIFLPYSDGYWISTLSPRLWEAYNLYGSYPQYLGSNVRPVCKY